MSKRIAFGLDYLLADIDTQLIKWKEKLQLEGDPFSMLLKDETFWATIPPFEDEDIIWDMIPKEYTYGQKVEYFVLTERPKTLELVTLSWLRRHFMPFQRDHVIYKSIKRFDCKLHKIDLHVDVKFDHPEWYQYDSIGMMKWER